MAATFPSQPDDDPRFPRVTLNRRTLTIGDATFNFGDGQPAYVSKHGIVITPGSNKAFNMFTVTFIVGEIHVEDDALQQLQVNQDASES